MTYKNFSVLMSVYKSEKAEYLMQSLDSILNQTVTPNEIVIVEDGKLTDELYEVLSQYEQKYAIVKRIPFSVNRGLGLALRDGVLACSNEIIARMDTDDIALPMRFEKQLEYLEKNPQISLLGTGIEEFSSAPECPDSKTILPANHEDIVKFSKKRNPFRHMTVMFKKSAVLDSGNYRDFLWFEDYDLWVRIIANGYKCANIPEVLVFVRADQNMFARRGGWAYLQQDIKFQIYLYKLRFINRNNLFFNILIRGVVRMIPNNMRSLFYKKFLRS